MTPKKKARKAIKATVRNLLRHGGATPAKELVQRINQALAGWVNYFRVGNSSRAFSEVRDYVEMKAEPCSRDGSGGESAASVGSDGVTSTSTVCSVCTGIGNSSPCRVRSSSRESGGQHRYDP
jgi:hypothetical protein